MNLSYHEFRLAIVWRQREEMLNTYWKLAVSVFIGAIFIVVGTTAPIPVVFQLIALVLGLVITVINLIVVTKRLL